jgi:hypothetical protein
VYAAAICAVLDEYPDDVVVLATDPRSGLPSRCQWLPTVKEVRDFCDAIIERRNREEERLRQLEQQWRERDNYEAEQWEKRTRTPEEQARVDAQVRRALDALKANAAREQKSDAQISKILAERDQFILRDYRAAGRAPVYTSDGRLISLSLIESLNEDRRHVVEANQSDTAQYSGPERVADALGPPAMRLDEQKT